MTQQEIPLHGGNTSVVVRSGDTVRRNAGPWTPAVHALLRHLEYVGFTGASNPGPVTDLEELQPLVAEAVARASHYMNTGVFNGAKAAIEARVGNWSRRTAEWREAADANPLIPRSVLEQRRITVEREQQIAAAMSPERQLIRPLLVVLPADRPTAEGTEE